MKAVEKNILQQKLSDFIVKYHKNELYQGLSIFVISFFSIFLLFGFIEFFLYLAPGFKTLVLLISVLVLFILFLFSVLRPLLRIFGLLNPLTSKRANEVIITHFPEIKDHLINALELIDQSLVSSDNSLLIASIEQKTAELRPIPFTSAINVKKALKFGLYGILVCFLFISIYSFWPDFTISTSRLINFRTVYHKPLPFQFHIVSDLSLSKGSKCNLIVQLSGDAIPNSLQIVTSTGTYLMRKTKSDQFEYQFSSVYDSFDFVFKSGEFTSDIYTVKVLPSPRIKNFVLTVLPPKYTGGKMFQAQSTTTISVPEGSKILWQLSATDTDSVLLIRNNDISKFSISSDSFEYETFARNSFIYSLVLHNAYFIDSTISNFTIEVDKDLFPKVQISERKDSTGKLVSYFKGVISDDFGLVSLKFNVRFIDSDSTVSIPVPFDKSRINQQFYFSFDFSTISQSHNFEYYFSVSDNDAVNGSKTTTSDHLFFNLPNKQELAQLEDRVNEKLMDKIDRAIDKSQKIQEEIKDLKAKLITDNLSHWQRNQMLQNISAKQNELQKLVNDINKENQSKNEIVQNLSDKDELKKKQEALQELMDKVMDDELKKLMDELKQMSEKFDRNKFFEMSEKLDMSYKDLSEQLDKNIELLKRYDLERKLDNTKSALEDLAKSQNKVGAELDKKQDNSNQNIEKEKQKMSQLEDEYKKLTEDNKALDKPFELEDFKSNFDDIKQEIQNSSTQQQSGKQKQSSQSMKNASQKSQDLAKKMGEMMEQNSQQQAMEDIDNLRQILDNLIIFSFDQEKLLSSSANISFQDPRVPQLANQQQLLRENFTIIQDSLYALARREPQIGTNVNKEVLDIQKNISASIRLMEDSKSNYAATHQQFVMTSTNNLALLLSEVLKSMQESASQNMSGQQQCQNPSKKGKGSPSLGQMKSQQQSLKQQLQQMIDQMKSEQNKPGGNKPGQGMSKQLSKMLGDQEKYNQQLNQLMKDGDLSPDAVKQLNEIKKLMDKNELDIVNRSVSPSTLSRQDQIISRLLEAEKAERERDQDDKRKAEQGNQQLKSNPEKYFSGDMQQYNFNDVIEHSTIELNKVYNQIYEDYLIQLSTDN